MKDRIKQIRKELDLTQQEFANKVGTSRTNIACYETGKNTPSDAVISLICAKCNVSEEWLRTGEGNMFLKIPEEDQYSKAAAALLRDDDALAIEGLKLYYSLSSDEKKAAANYILKLADLIREHEDKKE